MLHTFVIAGVITSLQACCPAQQQRIATEAISNIDFNMIALAILKSFEAIPKYTMTASTSC